MIGIDPKTGKMVSGYDALQCRFARILTTQVTSRVKRREVGNPAVERLGKNQSPAEAMVVQNLTLAALANEANGLSEFQATSCTATNGSKGFLVTVEGTWQGDALTLSGVL
ncbi:phage baseplate protein [Celerinatantimonas sp. MCCC 1A17872]|uniref:phage baseplate protein n=1 Tax=Celerinatantimonas sp. MCCC 1A17872 TaxID=3177514 RepID=UPI0038C4FA89